MTNIGVFDSGMGGLTVLKELIRLFPHAHYDYFGDTARLPYGSKSVETVAKYARSSARFRNTRMLSSSSARSIRAIVPSQSESSSQV